MKDKSSCKRGATTRHAVRVQEIPRARPYLQDALQIARQLHGRHYRPRLHVLPVCHHQSDRFLQSDGHILGCEAEPAVMRQRLLPGELAAGAREDQGPGRSAVFQGLKNKMKDQMLDFGN
ncbi:hypothetical protein KL941_002958 [Ogataea angusta]|nr:hypothetical protein KL941_002958 [Ogataea angusta]